MSLCGPAAIDSNRMPPLPVPAPEGRHHVLIVGGGFGGLYAAKTLGGTRIDLTLVDRRNFHLFQPLLYQVATGALRPGEIAQPLRSILRRQRQHDGPPRRGRRHRPGRARGPDVRRRPDRLRHARRRPGAHLAYFGHDDWARYAPGLKSLDDALEIRRRILIAFEAAEREARPGAGAASG